MNMTPHLKVVRMKPDNSTYAVAAGSADITSDILDTQGFEGVRFILGLGTITSGAVTSVKVQQGAAANMSDAADLLGSSQTIGDTDDNKVFVAEVYRPLKRYMRVITKRATQNAVVDFLLAELYGARGPQPLTQDATEGGTHEIFAGPAEGTA